MSLDATGVRQQGPGGTRADGRVAEFAGDFNGDGLVGGVDLRKWEQSITAGANSTGDSSSSRDGHDFLTWQQQLGKNNIDSDSTPVAIPEPGSALLLLLALMGVAIGRQN